MRCDIKKKITHYSMAFALPSRLHVISYQKSQMFGCSQYNKPSVVFAFPERKHAEKMREKIVQMRSLNVIENPKQEGEFMHKRAKSGQRAEELDVKDVQACSYDTEELIIYVGSHNIHLGIVDELRFISATNTVMCRSLSIEPVLETDSLLENLDDAFRLEIEHKE